MDFKEGRRMKEVTTVMFRSKLRGGRRREVVVSEARDICRFQSGLKYSVQLLDSALRKDAMHTWHLS